MSRRGRTLCCFAATALTVVVTISLVSGCGGGGSPGGIPTTRTAGTVILPAGFTPPLSSLHILASGAGSIASNGSFQFDNIGGYSNFPILVDASNKAVLMGVSRPGAPGGALTAEISPQQSAVALLFMATGAFMLPSDSHQNVIDLLEAHAATATLAGVIAREVAANPTALNDRDPVVATAILTAMQSMAGGTRAVQAGSAAGCPRRFQTRDGSLVNMLTEPSAAQSGVILQQSDDKTGLEITNTKRRHLLYYIQESGYKDAAGAQHSANTVIADGHFTSNWIPSTNKLNGTIGSITDVFTGNGAYQPYNNAPIPLPLNPTDAMETDYHVTVVGPGQDPGHAPKYGLDPYNLGQRDMVALGFVKDLLGPLLFAAADTKISASGLLAQAGLVDDARGLVSIIAASTHVALSLNSANAKDVALAVIKAIADDPTFRQQIINYFVAHLVKYFANIDDIQKHMNTLLLQESATKWNLWLLALDKAFALGDVAVMVNDWNSSNWFDEWDVKVVQATAKLSPGSATVQSGRTALFTASVPGNNSGPFTYSWSTTGANGTLLDAHGHTGTSFDSPDDKVTYSANSGAPDNGKDTVTVKAYVGSSPNRLYAGTAQSQITISARPPCDDVNDAQYASGCASVSLSSATVTAGDKLTVSVSVGCGDASLSCDYAYTNDVLLDGNTVAASGGGVSMYPSDPPKPAPRFNGAVVTVPHGSHTVTFHIKDSAPNDCLSLQGVYAAGPWVVLSGGSPNLWNTPRHFAVKQKGL